MGYKNAFLYQLCTTAQLFSFFVPFNLLFGATNMQQKSNNTHCSYIMGGL